MIQSKMIEKEEDLFCSQQHRLPVLMIACDNKLKKNERLMCQLCMENLEQKPEVIAFKKTLESIERNQMQKKEFIENLLITNIKDIQQLQNVLHQLKFDVVQKLDYLIGNADEWIKQIKLWGV
ncbi:unnamed protein product [Paramecium pentaurelia]|uniref:Uncharacterized protein n=1 Tax=Paramecium pentaurelia TaxID=43138 RepID=A0A8S1XCC7_9CILI|nr:unnamed protein product [Paramecium pentaurelia]